MKKILIADDDKIFQNLLEKIILKNFQVKIDLVNNTFDLINKASNEKYDLIITDYNMGIRPPNKGTYAIQILRKKNITTPIILLSSYLSDTLRSMAFKAGAQKVFTKYDIQKKTKELKEYLKI